MIGSMEDTETVSPAPVKFFALCETGSHSDKCEDADSVNLLLSFTEEVARRDDIVCAEDHDVDAAQQVRRHARVLQRLPSRRACYTDRLDWLFSPCRYVCRVDALFCIQTSTLRPKFEW